MHILSPETDNCPSWISGRERMTVENISRSISTKECCRPRRGLNPRPPGLQSDGASNWATEAISVVLMPYMLMVDSGGCQFSKASEAWNPSNPTPRPILFGATTVGPKKELIIYWDITFKILHIKRQNSRLLFDNVFEQNLIKQNAQKR